ncbi:hypothetical protein ACFC1B_07260 [Streptomyces xiamenensis]|uniref:hypothetical protein n=1 Tax=Streptomyces xiamenensis TaxID=408015 RepID=UPI0035DA3580
MTYPHLYATAGLEALAAEIDAERQRQIARFGDQQHPDGTGPRTASIGHGLEHADRAAADARLRCQNAARRGQTTWRDILAEEVYEAAAESDPAALRTELVQVAAVALAWIHDIDRRPV